MSTRRLKSKPRAPKGAGRGAQRRRKTATQGGTGTASQRQMTRTIRPVMTMNRFPGGFPDSEEVVLYWNQRYTITSTGGAGPVYIVLAANGPFDPDVYLSAVQPNNYDDWAVQYARYLPIDTRMTCILRDLKASTAAIPVPASVGMIVGPDAQDWSAAAVTFSNAYSRPRTKSVFSSKTGTTRVTMHHSADQMRGYSMAQGEGTETSSAQVTANPASLWYYNFLFSGDQDTVTDATIRLEMRIRFFARTSQNLDLFTRAKALKDARPKPKQVAGIKYFIEPPGDGKGDGKSTPTAETKGDPRVKISSAEAAADWDDATRLSEDDWEEFCQYKSQQRSKMMSLIATTPVFKPGAGAGSSTARPA